MPALVPGVQPFAAFSGTFTLSADQETITIGASPTEAVRTPWYDMGSGATLAKVLWDGTASGTIKGRSSATKPISMDDAALIQPADSEWAHYYDAAGGSAPNAAGWTKVGTVAAGSPSGGVYTMDYTGTAYFYKTTALGAADVTIMRIGVRPKTGHDGAFEVWTDVGASRYKFRLNGSAFVANERKLVINGVIVSGLTWNYDEWLDLAVVLRSGMAMLHYRQRGTNGRTDLIGMVSIADIPVAAGANLLLIGDVDTGIGGLVDIDHIGLWQGTEFETVTDADTSFTVNRRFWQVKGWENGTLTEVDLQSDLSSPAAPTGPTAGDIGTTAMGSTWTSVSGAAAYLVDTVNTGTSTTVDTQWVLGTVAATDGLAAGSYRHDVYAASDDGVRSATAGESNVVTLPATVSTPPTIGAAPEWVNGVLMFNKPTAGTNSLTGGTFKVLTATQAAGAYSVAASVSWASITWDSNDQVSAPSLGVTVSETAWYRDRITDSGNLVAEGQTAVYGGDEDSALCIVTFSGLTAGTAVACKLSAPCTVNGTTYPIYQASYTATVAGDGTASLTLPRCDTGENEEGSGIVFGYFTGASPAAFILQRRIPDSATATFASLAAP